MRHERAQETGQRGPFGSCEHDEVDEQGAYLDGIDGPQAPALRWKAPPRCSTA
jgi:hypothetical protein